MDEIKKIYKCIPNAISIIRIISAVAMAFTPLFSKVFYFCYLLCGLSDFADGFLARKLALTSLLGAKLDTVGDFVFIMIALIKIFPLVINVWWILVSCAIVFLIKMTTVGAVYYRFKKLASFHTIINKMTGFLLFVYPFCINIIGVRSFSIVVIIFAVIAACEEMIIAFKTQKLNPNVQRYNFKEKV